MLYELWSVEEDGTRVAIAGAAFPGKLIDKAEEIDKTNPEWNWLISETLSTGEIGIYLTKDQYNYYLHEISIWSERV